MSDVKRVVSTGLWKDLKVRTMFSPEDKYFLLYLLTNPYTTQLGIYDFPINHVALDMGYSEEAIKVLLDRFENKYGLIKYSTKSGEIAIKNYLKHSIVKGGKPVFDCLSKEEKNVKDKSLLKYVVNNINTTDTDSINKTVLDYINTISNKYINDNDNDNERFVHDSSTIRPFDSVDYEFYWNKVVEKYPNKNGLSTAKQIWMNHFIYKVLIGNREEVAKEILSAIDLFLEEYKKNHTDNFRYVPRLSKWFEEDMEYWLSQINRNSDDLESWEFT